MQTENVLKNKEIQHNKKIKNKKANFVYSPFQKNTKKSKKLQKVLKNIGLPSKAV